ncbi:hypothetical protein QR680_006340 [Steinernema hermaphroditum]|uniref:Chondroitin proteoglycan 4 domain-containing protein n=2 Tax=Steinernema hermaphroditum TaxID=289476 RepID=A0AA39HV32_9BILA|nr:hypothetical protein QR680_006340 [Steinernema hermaphroditum]
MAAKRTNWILSEIKESFGCLARLDQQSSKQCLRSCTRHHDAVTSLMQNFKHLALNGDSTQAEKYLDESCEYVTCTMHCDVPTIAHVCSFDTANLVVNLTRRSFASMERMALDTGAVSRWPAKCTDIKNYQLPSLPKLPPRNGSEETNSVQEDVRSSTLSRKSEEQPKTSNVSKSRLRLLRQSSSLSLKEPSAEQSISTAVFQVSAVLLSANRSFAERLPTRRNVEMLNVIEVAAVAFSSVIFVVFCIFQCSKKTPAPPPEAAKQPDKKPDGAPAKGTESKPVPNAAKAVQNKEPGSVKSKIAETLTCIDDPDLRTKSNYNSISSHRCFCDSATDSDRTVPSTSREVLHIGSLVLTHNMVAGSEVDVEDRQRDRSGEYSSLGYSTPSAVFAEDKWCRVVATALLVLNVLVVLAVFYQIERVFGGHVRHNRQ